jgi:hypothetical protein
VFGILGPSEVISCVFLLPHEPISFAFQCRYTAVRIRPTSQVQFSSACMHTCPHCSGDSPSWRSTNLIKDRLTAWMKPSWTASWTWLRRGV